MRRETDQRERKQEECSNNVWKKKDIERKLERGERVVDFGDDTPERLLELLQPDILVKGGDYDKEGVVGWKIVEGYGGTVKVMNFVDDCSTTAIVEKIQSSSQPYQAYQHLIPGTPRGVKRSQDGTCVNASSRDICRFPAENVHSTTKRNHVTAACFTRTASQSRAVILK